MRVPVWCTGGFTNDSWLGGKGFVRSTTAALRAFLRTRWPPPHGPGSSSDVVLCQICAGGGSRGASTLTRSHSTGGHGHKMQDAW